MFGYRMKVVWIALIMIIDGSESTPTSRPATDPYCHKVLREDKCHLLSWSLRYRYYPVTNECKRSLYCGRFEPKSRDHYKTEDECNKRCKKDTESLLAKFLYNIVKG
ncbi:Uncharacterised protein at_DN0855 [Pycnogonum litorale]